MNERGMNEWNDVKVAVETGDDVYMVDIRNAYKTNSQVNEKKKKIFHFIGNRNRNKKSKSTNYNNTYKGVRDFFFRRKKKKWWRRI